jgi:hypothetical protein
MARRGAQAAALGNRGDVAELGELHDRILAIPNCYLEAQSAI